MSSSHGRAAESGDLRLRRSPAAATSATRASYPAPRNACPRRSGRSVSKRLRGDTRQGWLSLRLAPSGRSAAGRRPSSRSPRTRAAGCGAWRACGTAGPVRRDAAEHEGQREGDKGHRAAAAPNGIFSRRRLSRDAPQWAPAPRTPQGEGGGPCLPAGNEALGLGEAGRWQRARHAIQVVLIPGGSPPSSAVFASVRYAYARTGSPLRPDTRTPRRQKQVPCRRPDCRLFEPLERVLRIASPGEVKSDLALGQDVSGARGDHHVVESPAGSSGTAPWHCPAR